MNRIVEENEKNKGF